LEHSDRVQQTRSLGPRCCAAASVAEDTQQFDVVLRGPAYDDFFLSLWAELLFACAHTHIANGLSLDAGHGNSSMVACTKRPVGDQSSLASSVGSSTTTPFPPEMTGIS